MGEKNCKERIFFAAALDSLTIIYKTANVKNCRLFRKYGKLLSANFFRAGQKIFC